MTMKIHTAYGMLVIGNMFLLDRLRNVYITQQELSLEETFQLWIKTNILENLGKVLNTRNKQ